MAVAYRFRSPEFDDAVRVAGRKAFSERLAAGVPPDVRLPFAASSRSISPESTLRVSFAGCFCRCSATSDA